MQVRNNEITIVRGESFTMCKRIVNRDGSPYIISSRLKNPYWKITVASSLYSDNRRYSVTKWLDLSGFPRFEKTRPVKLADYGLKFSDNTFPFIDLDSDDKSDFAGDETSGYANTAIFYEEDQNGVISYKYWEYIDNKEGNFEGRWVDYECLITTTFPYTLTSEWVEQNYLYNISLIDGILTEPVQSVYDMPFEVIEELYPILEATRLYVKSNLGR